MLQQNRKNKEREREFDGRGVNIGGLIRGETVGIENLVSGNERRAKPNKIYKGERERERYGRRERE